MAMSGSHAPADPVRLAASRGRATRGAPWCDYMQAIRKTGDAMSLLGQVRKVEQQVVERLKELEPLIGEYNQLRRLAQRLGVGYTPPEPDTSATPAPVRRRRAAKKGATARRAAGETRTARRAPAKRTAKRASGTRATGATSARSSRKATTAAQAQETATKAKTTARRGRGRKATSGRPGQRRDDVLRAVGEQPGITVREIGEQLGVDATGLYRVTNKLTEEGRLRKDGPRLYVVESGAAAPSDTPVDSAPPHAAGARPSSPSAACASGDGSPVAKATSST